MTPGVSLKRSTTEVILLKRETSSAFTVCSVGFTGVALTVIVGVDLAFVCRGKL